MAYTAPYTFTALELLTAAKMNAIQANITALWAGTTAGDMDYYTSSSAKTRVGIGGAGAILRSTGSAPSWLSIGTTGQILASNGTALNWVSGERYIFVHLNSDVALATGDYQGWFMIPPALNATNITHVSACRKAGGTGVPALQLRNVTYSLDVLSTKVTIDSGETTSGSAATQPVINTLNNYCETYAQFAVDVDAAGTNTFNCVFIVGFTKQ